MPIYYCKKAFLAILVPHRLPLLVGLIPCLVRQHIFNNMCPYRANNSNNSICNSSISSPLPHTTYHLYLRRALWVKPAYRAGLVLPVVTLVVTLVAEVGVVVILVPPSSKISSR